jgi:uncharacterized protein DUF6959
MERLEVEVYASDRNMAVIRMPGARTPGSVIPADPLRHLNFLAESILTRVREDHDQELCNDAEALVELLTHRLRVYEEATRGFSAEERRTSPTPRRGAERASSDRRARSE